MPNLRYLFDPLCGWCYGASPAVARLAAIPAVTLVLAPTGLFAGAGARPMDEAFATYAWSNDQRIAALTGQPFSDAYREIVLADRDRPFDSGPATLALSAVAETAPEEELTALQAIQQARYVQGCDVTDRAQLEDVLLALRLDAAVDRLRHGGAALQEFHQSRLDSARTEMREFGLQGVPALIVTDRQGKHPLPASVLFTHIDQLVEQLSIS